MPGDRKPRSILVIDDEPHIRELLVDALSSPDLRVLPAASGKQALELARTEPVDCVIADVGLGGENGLDVLDRLRGELTDLPAVVITGLRDADALEQATRRRPVELMTKPLDVRRLAGTVREALEHRGKYERLIRRNHRLRRLAGRVNRQRKRALKQLDTTCADLTQAYRTLSGQLALQKSVMAYQSELLAARNDDDVFSCLFRTFVRSSGGVQGVAMVCDADAELQVAGRFGVPQPDNPTFCQAVVKPVVHAVLADPRVLLMDAEEEAALFDEGIRRYLPGVSILAVPLLPSDGEMIGLVILYRKGEQPFTDADTALAELVGRPTAVAVRRND
jgi:DNA-binding response OmpR family regulator